MFKRLILLAAFLGLAACGQPNYVDYSQQANLDAQRTYQTQYTSYDQCYHMFSMPGDCYMGTNGIWYSPPYYSWGAVIHHNHMVTYGHVVPVGGVWIHPSYHVNVDFGRSRSYVYNRTNYYRSHSYTSNVSRPVYRSSSFSRSSFSTTSPNRVANPNVSRIRFGSGSSYTPPSRSSSFGHSSFSSSRSSSFGRSSFGSSRSSFSSSRSSFSSRRH